MHALTHSVLKPGQLLLLILSMMIISSSALAKPGNGKGGGGNGGGDPDPIFTAESDNPDIPRIDSYSLDSGEQIVFRNADMDLLQFKGEFPGGEPPVIMTLHTAHWY